MNNVTGDFYNIATLMAAGGFFNLADNDKERHLQEILDGKDDIDGQEIREHMDEFSCREEMERFVEDCDSGH